MIEAISNHHQGPAIVSIKTLYLRRPRIQEGVAPDRLCHLSCDLRREAGQVPAAQSHLQSVDLDIHQVEALPTPSFNFQGSAT